MNGPARLSLGEIREWLDFNEIDTRRTHWARCLRTLDRAWMDWTHSQHGR